MLLVRILFSNKQHGMIAEHKMLRCYRCDYSICEEICHSVINCNWIECDDILWHDTIGFYDLYYNCEISHRDLSCLRQIYNTKHGYINMCYSSSLEKR